MTRSIGNSGKVLAWFGIVSGGLTLPWLLLFALTAESLPLFGVVTTLLISLGSIVAGVFGLRGNVWAFWLLFAAFLVQMVEYLSETFFLSFIGPISFKVGFTWVSPPARLNLNVLALLVCIFAVRTANRLARGGDGIDATSTLTIDPETDSTQTSSNED